MTNTTLRPLLFPTSLMTLGIFMLVALQPQESHALGKALTVLGLILAGKMAKTGLEDTLDTVKDDAKELISHTTDEIDGLIEQLEETYAGALNTTLESLDTFSGQQLMKLAGFFDRINDKLMQDWSIVHEDVIGLLKEVNGTIQQTLSRVEDLMVVGVQGATFLIDKTTFNAAFLLAVVLTAVGLLLFVRLLWTVKRPKGWTQIGATVLMGLYLAFSFTLLFPQPRAYALTMTGQSQRLEEIGSGPHLFTVTPDRLLAGEPGELILVGANFDSGGAPKVKLGNKTIVPASWSTNHIVVKLNSAQTKQEGRQGITVLTARGEVSDGQIVHFQPPPRPAEILSWRLTATGQRYGLKKDTEPKSLWFDCDEKIGKSGRFGIDSVTIELEPGWTVDRSRAATYREAWGTPDLRTGFTETAVLTTAATRRVSIMPSDKGIVVTAQCAGSNKDFRAKYVVHARKFALGTGGAKSGGAVNLTGSGMKTLATYPNEELDLFKNQRPEYYTLLLQLRSTTGEMVDRKFEFPTGSTAAVGFEDISLWMENNHVRIKRIGGSAQDESRTRRRLLLADMQKTVEVAAKGVPIVHQTKKR